MNGDRSTRSVAVIVVAAGRGERLAGAAPKALETIEGRSLLAHALSEIADVPDISQIVVAAPATHMAQTQAVCRQFVGLVPTVVAGGKERQDSVRLAIDALAPGIDIVIVHDAARAFAPAKVFVRVIDAVASGHAAVVPGMSVIDTIKDVDADGRVRRTVPRASLRAVQTPQGFSRAVLAEAHENAIVGRTGASDCADSASFPKPTDDAGMLEAAGYDVWMVAGDPDAFKITTPFDRLIAQALVTRREETND